MLQPSTCGEGGGRGRQVAWRGRTKPPGATCPGPGGARAPALLVWRGRGGRWLGGGRSPWRHPSAHMATGGVWNLLQVLFALFAHGHRRRKPSAPGAFCTVLLMEQVAEATCIFVQKALKWPKSLVAHVAIATCASAKRPLQARVRWHDASQVAWSRLPGPISHLAGPLLLPLAC